MSKQPWPQDKSKLSGNQRSVFKDYGFEPGSEESSHVRVISKEAE